MKKESNWPSPEKNTLKRANLLRVKNQLFEIYKIFNDFQPQLNLKIEFKKEQKTF